MATQLAAFLAANGPDIEVGGRRLSVGTVDPDMQMACFKGPRATYTGVRCLNAKVAGDPTAEVWSVLGNRGQTIVEFAVSGGQLKTLSR